VIHKRLRKIVVGLVTVALTFTGLTVTAPPSQAALNGSTFDPGLIISDSVFNDWGTMDAASIQKFLNARVPVCDDNDGGPKCLRNYKEDVVGSYAIRNSLHSYSLKVCADVPAANDRTAAQIIASVAVACKINPRVLLVTLQKEQGLVSAKDPTTYMYKAAMGYGCPDSAPQICGQDSNAKSRLFWQMYRAAWQLKWYGDPRGSFTYLKPGKTISMGYNPKASCGRQTFKLKSQATAKLYYYTPYVPNKSALNNLWGSGDSCGAYGNRNFWRQFWTWFGSPVAGGYILKSSTNDTYLVNQDTNKRYLISQTSLVADFQPLGPVGTVSEAYLSSFTNAGDLKSVVSDSSGKRYMIVSGYKYPLSTSTQAANLGLDWATASGLTDVQVDNFTNLAFGKSLSSGEIFLLDGATRRLVSSSDLHKTLSILGGTATLSDEFLNRFTLGSPATALIQNAAGSRFGIFDGKRIQLFNSTQTTALGLDWNQATTISDVNIQSIPSAAFIKSNSTPFLVTEGKKNALTASEYATISVFGSVATVSADLLSKFQSGPPMAGLLRTPTYTYLVSGGARHRITQAQVTSMNNAGGSSLSWNNVPQVTDQQANLIMRPDILKAVGSTQTYLVVDYISKHPISDENLKHFSKLGSAYSVPASYLATFTTGLNGQRFVQGADGVNYFLSETKKFRVDSAVVAKQISPSAFPDSTPSFRNLPKFRTNQLALFSSPSSSPITNYVKSTSERYLIQDGKRREVLDDQSLAVRVNPIPAISVLTPADVNQLPLGTPIYAEGSLVSVVGGSPSGILQDGSFYEVPKSMLTDAKSSDAWRFHKSTSTLSSASLSKMNKGATLAPFVTAEGVSYLLSASGKTLITDPQNVKLTMTNIPSNLLSRIETSSVGPITTPLIVSLSSNTKYNYLIGSAKKRLIVSASQISGVLKATNVPAKISWPDYALESIQTADNVFSPGQIVKVRESGNLYLIDGWSRGWALTQAQASAFGAKSPLVFQRKNFIGYNTSSKLAWQKFVCGTRTYIADAGKLVPLEAAAVAHWPGAATKLADDTCRNLNLETTQIGALAAYGTGRYQISGGKLRLIRTDAEYTALAQNRIGAVAVSKVMFSLIPKGNPTSYVVVAGDNLSKVAGKFKTTKTVLKSINRLSTEVLQRGQVLLLP
jgi:hypothetical protein